MGLQYIAPIVLCVAFTLMNKTMGTSREVWHCTQVCDAEMINFVLLTVMILQEVTVGLGSTILMLKNVISSKNQLQPFLSSYLLTKLLLVKPEKIG